MGDASVEGSETVTGGDAAGAGDSGRLGEIVSRLEQISARLGAEELGDAEAAELTEEAAALAGEAVGAADELMRTATASDE